MRFTSESVVHDLEVALKERSEMEWSNIDRLLIKAQLHIARLQRQIDYKELTDEEIVTVRQKTKTKSTENWADTLAFGHALLKKAREK